MPELVAVGERGLQRVVAHRRHVDDLHLALAGLQHLLPGTVALHLGRRRVDPQQLERQLESRPVGKPDLQHARALVQRDGSRCGRS